MFYWEEITVAAFGSSGVPCVEPNLSRACTGRAFCPSRQMAPRSAKSKGDGAKKTRISTKKSVGQTRELPASLPKELAAAALATDATDEEDPRSGRKLSRRDSDDRTTRVMQLKLCPHFKKEAIEGLRADGVSVRQYIKQALKGLPEKKKLNTEFWTTFFKKFPLKTGVASLLPPPPASYKEFNSDLLDALAAAHAVNPAKRDPSEFVQIMEVLDDMTSAEMHCTLLSIEESPTISPSSAAQMQLAFLSFLSRTGNGVNKFA